MTDTKHKILDAAERSFAENGFAGTSVRSVISEAGVNLAAVHYHFGSKEELLRAVIMRRADPLNAERVSMLEDFERQAGGCPLRLERVLEAFIAPTLRVVTQPAGAQIVRLMARIYAEGDVLPRIVHENFAPTLRRFGEALQAAVPELPREELYWRLYLSIGVMAQGLRGLNDIERMTAGACRRGDAASVQNRLIAYLCAGIRARSTV